MAIKAEYKAYLYDNDQLIDETCIDENNAEFAMYLFKEEFGHKHLSDSASVIIEPMGFYDEETGKEVIIHKVDQNMRINPVDDMPQFKIVYADGEWTQVEAESLEEAVMIAEDFNKEGVE